MDMALKGIHIEKYSDHVIKAMNRFMEELQNSSEDEYYEVATDYDALSWQKEHQDEAKKEDYIMNGDNLLGIMTYEKLYGVDVCCPIMFDNRQNEKVEKIMADFLKAKNIYIVEKNRSSNLFAEHELINHKTSDDKEDYRFSYYDAMCPLSNEHINDIRNAFEKEYYVDNIDGYKIEKMNEKQLKNGLETIVRDNCNNVHYPGMHYFKPDDYFHGNDYYIVAHKDNHILGVLKMYIRGDEQSLSYIDVCKRYQNKGIATEMIKELDKYLDKTKPLNLSSQSDIGRMCHMAELCENNIHSTNVIRSSMDIDLDEIIAAKTLRNDRKENVNEEIEK